MIPDAYAETTNISSIKYLGGREEQRAGGFFFFIKSRKMLSHPARFMLKTGLGQLEDLVQKNDPRATHDIHE